MQSFDTLCVFFAASLLLGITPGPDNLFVLAQAAQRGKVAGIVVTFGLTTGILFHTVAVALGAAALFATSALAFNVLKYVGAAYLLYLAYLSWRASGTSRGQARVSDVSLKKLYGRGIVMSITNPKVSIFFLAFLPQFTEPASGPLLPQFLLLGVLFVLSTLLVFGGISCLAGWIGSSLRSSKGSERLLNRFAGVVFLSLAAKIAFIQR